MFKDDQEFKPASSYQKLFYMSKQIFFMLYFETFAICVRKRSFFPRDIGTLESSLMIM